MLIVRRLREDWFATSSPWTRSMGRHLGLTYPAPEFADALLKAGRV